jgi:hypothetical protein
VKLERKNEPSIRFKTQTASISVTSLYTPYTHIGKICAPALLDTGSQISLIDLQTYNKTKLQQKFPLVSSHIHFISGINEQKVKVLGQTELPIRLGGITTYPTFHVVSKLSHPIILGLEFLQENNASINFQDNTLSLQKGLATIQLNSSQQDTSTAFVRLVDTTIIPPFSESIVPVKRPAIDHRHKAAILHPNARLLESLNVAGARCLVRADTETVPFRLLNPTKHPIQIKANTKLAEYVTLPDSTTVTPITPDTITSHTTSLINKPNDNKSDRTWH